MTLNPTPATPLHFSTSLLLMLLSTFPPFLHYPAVVVPAPPLFSIFAAALICALRRSWRDRMSISSLKRLQSSAHVWVERPRRPVRRLDWRSLGRERRNFSRRSQSATSRPTDLPSESRVEKASKCACISWEVAFSRRMRVLRRQEISPF